MIEEAEFPPEGRRREPHRPQRMTDIVLAVPERTLAILPGLPPMNGREPHEESALRKRCRQGCPDQGIEIRAALEAVRLRCVVVDAGTVVDRVQLRQKGVSPT